MKFNFHHCMIMSIMILGRHLNPRASSGRRDLLLARMASFGCPDGGLGAGRSGLVIVPTLGLSRCRGNGIQECVRLSHRAVETVVKRLEIKASSEERVISK